MVIELRDRWAREYDAHHHTVVLALLANGVRLAEARELAHDAWARLFEKDSEARLERLELPGLIIRQAFFLLIERRRRASTQARRDEGLDRAVKLAAHQPTPEDVVSGRQVLGVVTRALATSSPRGQSVMSAIVSGPDALHEQLARHEGISLQRFRQVLCEVRSQLRAALERGS